jgi:alpha-tubulin suppressor-like RCC1 family protein
MNVGSPWSSGLCVAPVSGALVAFFSLALFTACSSGPAANAPDARVSVDVPERALPTLSPASVAAIRVAQGRTDAMYALQHSSTGALSAPQPHQLVEVSLDADAIVVGDDALRLRFDGIGRTSEHLAPIARRSLRVRDQRATSGAAAVEVWFANGRLGLEHGLTLASAPYGEGHLVVSLETSEPARPASSAEGDGLQVTFETAAGVVRYYGPSAHDARGTALPAGFVVERGALTIEVDDEGAMYPIEIDPLVTTQTKLASAEADNFGTALSLDGSTIVVGAPFDDDAAPDAGAVYVFVESAGVWTLQQKIVPTGGTSTERFGTTLAVLGGTLVVGAPYADDVATDSGAAYLFTRSGTTWSQTDRLKSMDAAAADGFGWSVDVGTDAIAVGVPYDDNARGVDAGSVVLYDLTAGIATLRSTVQTALGAADDYFGYRVALDGDLVAASAWGDDDGGANGGALFVFDRAISGADWVQRATLVPLERDGNTRDGDHVGYSLDLSHDAAGVYTLAAGSVADDEFGTAAGAVWVFTSTSPAFTATTQQKLLPIGGGAGWQFGSDVDVDGTSLAIGAYTVPASSHGSAYLFNRAATGWRFDGPVVTALDLPTAAQYFGQAVGLKGRRLAVAAVFAAAPDTPSGAVYLQELSGFLGDVCMLDSECGTGFCVDGVCCDTACGAGAIDDCQACAIGAHGTVDGTCTGLAADAAPLVTCRASSGACDVADVCVAGDPVCSDARLAAGTTCRAPAGDCDLAEECDGGTTCPADVKSTAECRHAAGWCDISEYCDGIEDSCPIDALWPAGFDCRPVLYPCDVREICSGSSVDCPVDIYLPAGTACRAAAGPCDIEEQCNGIAVTCPPDAFQAPSTTCRPAVGACDIAEQCAGGTALCPADELEGTGVVCRASVSLCDVVETCSGTSVDCPADVGAVAGTECRPDSDGTGCDVADYCDGIDTSCPDDTLSPTCEDQRVSVAPGRYHTCVVRADGTLYCWGDNTFGQLGLGVAGSSLLPVRVGTQANWKTVVAGAFHTCAITTGGAVYCWGRNDRGQAGADPADPATSLTIDTPRLVSLTGATGLALGDFHSCALAGSAVYCWGANALGQLGRGTSADSYTPVGVAGIYTQVAAGANHSCALSSDGAVACWGSNATGQIGSSVPIGAWSALPVAVSGLPAADERATSLAAGGPRTCVTYRSYGVACWGSNAARRSGDSLGYSTTPIDMGFTDAVGVTLGESHLCVRKLAGDVGCWGDNSFGQLGDTSTASRWLLPASIVSTSRDAVALVTGPMHTCAVLLPVPGETAAPLVCWGRGEEGQLGDGNDRDRVRRIERVGTSIVDLASGATHTCARVDDASQVLMCWGDDAYGETGPAAAPDVRAHDGVRFEAAPVLDGASISDGLVSGEGFSCAPADTGTGTVLYCWGRNDQGQLGNGVGADHVATPGIVPGFLPATGRGTVAAGRAHACAIDTAGQLWCWGANGEGQLGDATLTSRRTPVRVRLGVSDTAAWAVSAGAAHTCAIDTNYDLWCWGRNGQGQVGDGGGGDTVPPLIADDLPDGGLDLGAPPLPITLTSRLTPQLVWQYVDGLATGDDHTCLHSQGTVRCWGANDYGQLGTGNTTPSATPTPVAAAFANLYFLDGGAHHTCAVKLVSWSPLITELYCWGRNDSLQLGVEPPATVVSAPVLVPISQPGLVSAGRDHTCVIGAETPDLYCWGRNEYGQVGNRGFRANRVAPTTVPLP